MNMGLKPIAKIVLFFCIVGVALITYMEISVVGTDSSAEKLLPHRGYMFAVLILMALWAIATLTRSTGPSGRSPFLRKLKILLASYALGGAIFMALSIGSLAIFGSAGMRAMFDNMLVVISLGMIVSLPIVIRRLR